MEEMEGQVEDEIDDLKQQIERFKKEKEKVRLIVGKIGGMPALNTKIFNIIFITLVLVFLVISLISGGTLRLAMIELAVAAIALKIIYVIHNQARVNHFQLWILTSLEWRLSEMNKAIQEDRK